MCKEIKWNPLGFPCLAESLCVFTGPMELRRCGWPELCTSAHLRQAPLSPINQGSQPGDLLEAQDSSAFRCSSPAALTAAVAALLNGPAK